MMTAEMMMTMLETLVQAGDVELCHVSDTEIRVDFVDFIGFDDDWCEEFRDYTMPELVEQVEDIVAELGTGDYYHEVVLDGMGFVFGYTSYDI
jgi:hypothetical protein